MCDCDVLFGINPDIIFDDQNYIKYGCFLFKDYFGHYPSNKDEINNRIKYIKNLIPNKNEYFPKEWDFVYTNEFNSKQHTWYYVDSGVVFINKQQHSDIVDTLYTLNYDWKETYKYIFGDKETFWLSFVINNKPFYINKIAGSNYYLDRSRINYCNKPHVLTHIYNNKYIFSQKGYPLLIYK